MIQTVNYRDCGFIQYKTAWDLQEQLLSENTQLKLSYLHTGIPASDIPTHHHLLFCEHNHVYTLGKSGKREHLLISEEECTEKNIEFFQINRGGDITYHGQGQITGYPIFDLDKFKPDLHWYMRNMEEVIINTLKDFGLNGARMNGFTGVWLHSDSVMPLKICAMGVRCSRWVTMHGFAFNVNTDLSYFDYIVPCGLEGKGATSLERELGRKIDMEEVKEKLKFHFAKEFGYEYD
ncbi:MAG: lipoyl(octanoyl) transferase LipB [Bacteroidia bacterium]|nr:lipoyl(octanoyl) transferase LipB [Bacteroidia bacterium]